MSLLAHVAVAGLFLHPRPSVGVSSDAIPVEVVVFGADEPAGVATEPQEGEQEPQPVDEQKQQPVAEQEQPIVTEKPTVTEEPAQVAVAPEPDPEPTPVVPRAEPEAALPKPQEPERERPNEEKAKKEKPEGKKKKAEASKQAHAAVGGIGRGRSQSAPSYNGRVAAHLARYKRFPEGPQGSGKQGTAVVEFVLDGGGKVSAVKLVRSSGVTAIDREAQDTVRRASPFPAPPFSGTADFTVPLSFRQP